LEGLEIQRARIEDQVSEVRRLIGARKQKPGASPEASPRKRKVSAAARKRMAAAQRKRWADRRRSLGTAKLTKRETAPRKPVAKAPAMAPVSTLKTSAGRARRKAPNKRAGFKRPGKKATQETESSGP
jgi:hypothetical protein